MQSDEPILPVPDELGDNDRACAEFPHWSKTRIGGAPAGGGIGLLGVHQQGVKEFFDGPQGPPRDRKREDIMELGRLIQKYARG